MLKPNVFIGTICLLFAARLQAGEFPNDWSWDDDSTARNHHAELEGKPMPPLNLKDWINGEVTPESLKGKVVVIDFYATWCAPCIAAIPHNNEVLKKYKDKGLVLFGVCTSPEGQELMAKVAKDKGMQYPTAHDPESKAAEAWRADIFPTYAVIDRKGILRALSLNPEYLEKVVEKLLNESKT